MAAQGPSTIAMIPAPTACAVVPSGIGMLNIITRKHMAEKRASVGTCLVRTTVRTLRAATASVGTATAKPTTQVCGLRYPSGMCTLPPLALVASLLH